MHDRRILSDPAAHTVRQFPRIEIGGELVGTGVTTGLSVRFRNVSPGGFLTESSEPVAIGTVETFAVVLPNGLSVTLGAEAVHGRSSDRDLVSHFTGWKARPDERTERGLQRILDYQAAVAAATVV